MTPRQQLDAAMKADRNANRQGARRAKRKQDSRGRWHPSGEEADWFDTMYAREQRGELTIDEIEPAFVIKGPKGEHVCVVKADMAVIERPSLRRRILDYKGWHGDTEVSRLKQTLARVFCGVEIEFVGPYIEAKAKKKAANKAKRDLVTRHNRERRARAKALAKAEREATRQQEKAASRALKR